jgi:hypothetical protein
MHPALKAVARPAASALRAFHAKALLDRVGAIDAATQLTLAMQYRALVAQGAPLPRVEETGFRCFSQNGEDGCLLYLFSVLGTTNRVAVEIGVGTGIECNSANLVVNHGWTALMFEGDDRDLALGRAFYARTPTTRAWPPTLAAAWVSPESVNSLMQQHGVSGEVDLFSLDIDSIDLHVWRGLTAISPRVVVVEYSNLWPAGEARTLPMGTPPQGDFRGASLEAFVAVGREKGYRLVGAERYHFNAFFVRNDVGSELLPEVDVASCLTHPLAQHAQGERLAAVRAFPWETVTARHP